MVNNYATISSLEDSDLYTKNSSLVKIDWNLDDIGVHLNDEYWYEDDFMRCFTLLIASQKNNNIRTIFFDDVSNADDEIYNVIKQSCRTNDIYIIFFIGNNYAAGHWITLHIAKITKRLIIIIQDNI